MKKLAMVLILLSIPAHAATYKSVDVNMHGWDFSYDVTVDKKTDFRFAQSGLGQVYHLPFRAFVPNCFKKIKFDVCAKSETEARTIADKKAKKREQELVNGK